MRHVVRMREYGASFHQRFTQQTHPMTLVVSSVLLVSQVLHVRATVFPGGGCVRCSPTAPRGLAASVRFQTNMPVLSCGVSVGWTHAAYSSKKGNDLLSTRLQTPRESGCQQGHDFPSKSPADEFPVAVILWTAMMGTGFNPCSLSRGERRGGQTWIGGQALLARWHPRVIGWFTSWVDDGDRKILTYVGSQHKYLEHRGL